MTKILTREAIQRMMRDANNVQRGQGGSGSGGGGGQAVSLANLSDVAISTPINDGSLLTFDATTGAWVNGPDVLTTMWGALEAVGTEQIDASHLTGVLGDYATETWVSQNFISIAYFDRLFRAYNGNTLVNHNDTESNITNIKAMFGFWTEQYLSALGSSGGGSVSLTLANMGDVALNNLADGQILVYDATEGKWVNVNAGGTADMTMVWAALAASTNEQINISHLSDACDGSYLRISRYTSLGASSTNPIDLNNITTVGTYVQGADAATQYVSNKPTTNNYTFRLIVEYTRSYSTYNNWLRQRYQEYNSPVVYERRSNINGSFANSTWYRVQDNLANYLPLTGGTLTGDLFFTGYNNRMFGIKRTSASSGQDVANNIDVGWDWANRDGAGAYFRSVEAGTLAGDFGLFARNATRQCELVGKPDGTLTWGGANILTASNVKTIGGQSIYGTGDIEVGGGDYLPLTGGTLTGRLTINASVADVLVLNRTSASSVVRMDLAQGGTVYGNLGLDASHNIILRTTSSGTHTVRLQINTNGNVGIGTTSPNYKLHVNGTLGAGNTSVANLESEGYVSALSDIRKKDVVEYMDGLPIEQIASMRIIRYTWKDRPEDGLQVGSIAQDWQKILPESVHTTRKGFLSFADSRAALVASISNSRELVKHDERLTAQDLRLSKIEKLLNIA